MNPAQFISKIIERKKNYRSYLEIGCRSNATFKAVSLPDKTGVDPETGGTHRMTSDTFFEKYFDLKFDLIFVDGLHEKEQVQRDILNSLASLNKGGVILIHDCLPRTPQNQYSVEEFRDAFNAEPPDGKAWNGDVWKGIVKLRTREWPDICVLNEDWGMGIAMDRSNSQRVLKDVSNLDWRTFCTRKEELLRIVDQNQAFEFMEI